jgi:hypothetical protein
MKTKIITFALIPVIILVAFLLVQSVKGPIDMQNRIKSQQEAVIKKLKFLRELQQTYLLRYKKVLPLGSSIGEIFRHLELI